MSKTPDHPSKTARSGSPAIQPAKVATASASARSPSVQSQGGPVRVMPGSAMEIERLDVGGNFSRWIDRFDVAARFYRWDDAGRAQVLLMRLSPALYDSLADRVAPTKPSRLTSAELEAALTELLVPATFVLAERFTFQQCSRTPGEQVRAFAERLLRAAEKCQFDNKDERLRDQFICGLMDQQVVGKLLVKDHHNLSFKEAVAEAEAHSTLVATDIMKNTPKGEGTGVMRVGISRTSQRCFRGGTQPPTANSHGPRCSRCGNLHGKTACPASGKKCRKCGKLNHFESVCRSRPNSEKQKGERKIQFVSSEPPIESEMFSICAVTEHSQEAINITLHFLGERREIPVQCQVDTGAAVSVMSDKVWSEIGNPELQPSGIKLTGYVDSHEFHTLGQFKGTVRFHGSLHDIPFHVVRSSRPFALLGRDALTIEIGYTRPQEHKGTEFKAKLQLIPDAVPRYIKARQLPFAYKDALKAEIDSLLSKGIITPVQFSEWASPIVVVPKSNGSIRLCVDYKQTLNPQLVKDSHPNPTADEAFSAVAGCRWYTILDLEAAFNQIELEEGSRPLTVMSTPFGNFQFNRLVFGITTAPSIFQRYITQVVQGVEGTVAYVDDILIGGRTLEELQSREKQVRECLKQHNLNVNENKCQVSQRRVRFLGFVLENGMIRPDPEKVRAFKEMAAPKNVAELESLIGLIKFSGRFIKCLSNLLEPLSRALGKRPEFVWTIEQENAFQKLKDALSAESALIN